MTIDTWPGCNLDIFCGIGGISIFGHVNTEEDDSAFLTEAKKILINIKKNF